MLNLKNYYSIILAGMCASMLWLSSCKEEESTQQLENEISLTNSGTLSVTEKDTTVVVSYEFLVATREAGEVVINATVDNLTHGTNYTTNPAESSGVITVPFQAGVSSISFEVSVIDDNANLPDGSVTFTLAEISGENAIITANASLKLTIIDNEGESITAASDETIQLGEVVFGTQSEAQEVSFTTLNIISDINAAASAGFVVSASADGTYASTASLASDATSFFVKAAPDATAALGSASGTVTLTAGEAETVFNVEAIVSDAIGVLFWAEDFDYPINDTHQSYGENGGQSYVPVSAHLRLNANYNGTNSEFTGLQGLTREGHLDTWYTQIRLRGLAMGDNPLIFDTYPGSGVGRTLRMAKDGSQTTQNNNNCDNWESKNSAIGRRFVPNGQEITEGTVYLATMIKVNAVFEEVEGGVLKNAIIMLTGDAGFVNNNAMKINVESDGAGGFHLGVSKSNDDGSVVYADKSYTLGATYAVVMKVEIKADNEGEDPNDVVSLFVFEEGSAIPPYESAELTPVAVLDQSNQDLTDVHDVVDGLETVFIREVADDWAARPVGTQVQDVEMSGIRIATSWYSLFKDKAMAMYDSESEDVLQTVKMGNDKCGGEGNQDK